MDKDMSQSNRQSSADGRSADSFEDHVADDSDDTATLQVTREPFWAFCPQVTTWAAGLVAGELDTARAAVVGFPTWSIQYLHETVDFYRQNPRILANEVGVAQPCLARVYCCWCDTTP